MKPIFLLLFLLTSMLSQAQQRLWLLKVGKDSVMRVRPETDFYDREDSFNGTYWNEGSRTRFNFPYGTRKFKTGLYRGWTTSAEFQFMDAQGNHLNDSAIWATGQIQNFKPIGIWRKYHLNGNVALERDYCNGTPCGKISLFYEKGQVKSSGTIDTNAYPHGTWKAWFENGKPKWEMDFEHGITKGWSAHYNETGLISKVHFTSGQWANNYNEMLLYYPETGMMKAKMELRNSRPIIMDAWDEKGKQTLSNGNGFIRGEYAQFEKGKIEARIINGEMRSDCKRYYDADGKKLRSDVREDSLIPGLLHSTGYYENGVMNYKFSYRYSDVTSRVDIIQEGPSVYFHPNGQISHSLSFEHDAAVGLFKQWNEKGILLAEVVFTEHYDSTYSHVKAIDDLFMSVSGVPDGTWKHWSNNGVLISESAYSKGLRHGVWKTYHENGKLKTLREYRNDEPIGDEKQFGIDGKKIDKKKEKCPSQNWGSSYICSEHGLVSVTDDIGVCSNCRKGTSSGMFGLCAQCACKLGRCQMCGRKW